MMTFVSRFLSRFMLATMLMTPMTSGVFAMDVDKSLEDEDQKLYCAQMTIKEARKLVRLADLRLSNPDDPEIANVREVDLPILAHLNGFRDEIQYFLTYGEFVLRQGRYAEPGASKASQEEWDAANDSGFINSIRTMFQAELRSVLDELNAYIAFFASGEIQSPKAEQEMKLLLDSLAKKLYILHTQIPAGSTFVYPPL